MQQLSCNHNFAVPCYYQLCISSYKSYWILIVKTRFNDFTWFLFVQSIMALWLSLYVFKRPGFKSQSSFSEKAIIQ